MLLKKVQFINFSAAADHAGRGQMRYTNDGPKLHIDMYARATPVYACGKVETIVKTGQWNGFNSKWHKPDAKGELQPLTKVDRINNTMVMQPTEKLTPTRFLQRQKSFGEAEVDLHNINAIIRQMIAFKGYHANNALYLQVNAGQTQFNIATSIEFNYYDKKFKFYIPYINIKAAYRYEVVHFKPEYYTEFLQLSATKKRNVITQQQLIKSETTKFVPVFANGQPVYKEDGRLKMFPKVTREYFPLQIINTEQIVDVNLNMLRNKYVTYDYVYDFMIDGNQLRKIARDFKTYLQSIIIETP